MATNLPPIPAIETDVLIVGAGPAGGSLASFLAYYGVKGLMISRDRSTALQPRAHYTNPGAWECLRDIGLEQEWRQVAVPKELFGDYRFCYSLAGDELARSYSFGRLPEQLGEYQDVSPCEHADVSQNVGEPIFVKYASNHGFDVRFGCKLVSFENDLSTGLVTSLIEDQVTRTQFRVVSKYLCGADGANSTVGRLARLPYQTAPSNGVALNVWYEADLSHLHKNSPGHMHQVFTPDIDAPEWSVFGVNRAVRPWTEFVMGMIARPEVTEINIDPVAVHARLQQMIGDPDVKITIKGIYRWKINESYAEAMSKDNNVFILGDAAHRHPPSNALGSNTCIQDGYNLAWKLAYVLQGKAHPRILGSFDAERQVVGKRVVRVANNTVHKFRAFFHALGMTEPTVEARMAAIKQLGEPGVAGAARRAALRKAREIAMDDVQGLGADMNQAYVSSMVYLDDETEAGPGWDDESGAGVRHHCISTYPGSRLPHAWVGTSRTEEKISTHDLAGKGQFTLFTGIGGKEAWTGAAEKVTAALGGDGGSQVAVTINVHAIGFGQEHRDIFGMWEDRRGVDEDGAVLVRPDRTVAWRSRRLDVDLCGEQLTRVMKRILGF